MQTVETLNEGLKRAYTLTITAADIDAKVDAEVKRVAPQVKMPGFRPGKVPANLVRKMHGESLAADALNTAIQQDEQLQKFADQSKTWDDADDKAAEMGDLVTVDFVGKTADDVAFEGGTGTDMGVELGSGRLIPGFEEQLVGVKLGEEKTLNVTFPEDYGAKELAGQPATFDIIVKKIQVAGESKIDENLAKNLGLESLDQLRGLIKGQIEQEHNGLTRTHMKRKLLDQLAEGHDFEVPPSMVEAEFAQIWQQLEHEATHEDDPAAALAEMESERDDYRKIAERRVRLGLLLSEIGQANGVEVSQQEMNRLIAQAAQQYRGEDQQRFIQYVQQEPMAAAQLRAPLYEDKVVDFLFDKAEVTDREATREELEAAIESEDGFATGTHSHDHDNHKPRAKKKSDAAEGEAKPAKKAAAKKPVAKDDNAGVEVEEAAATEEAPAKKPRAKKAAAPVEAETAVTESSPVAAEAAEGTEAADAPAKKPRAKKAKSEA